MCSDLTILNIYIKIKNRAIRNQKENNNKITIMIAIIAYIYT